MEINVPQIGESITEVQIGDWLKKEGDTVQKDEPVATLESEKATVDLPAPAAGTLVKLLKKKGQTAKVGETIAQLEAGPAGSSATSEPDASRAKPKPVQKSKQPPAAASELAAPRVMPSAERLLAEHDLQPGMVEATGPGGRLLKEDVLRHLQASSSSTSPRQPEPPAAQQPPPGPSFDRQEEVTPMTPLRRTLAKRLVEAQHTAAMLTTFNEVDMSSVMELRRELGEAFQKRHGIKLGLMSFFVKAVIDALKLVPQLNAELRGENIVYRHYYDIGVAIGAGKGLVVPVLRNAERLSFAELEMAIVDFARRAQVNKLKIEELQGGTFTISNGGVYGSLLSTPILNPPQSGILGMHATQDRPIARDGSVVIRPMMYLALSYDHRIVDGREAVSFLRRIKEAIETPARMLLEV